MPLFRTKMRHIHHRRRIIRQHLHGIHDVEPSITKQGLGLGVNYEVFDGMRLIGEVTPVSDGRDPTWALGARYDLPNGKWSIDATATNAIGRYGHGTMVAQNDTRFAVGLSTQFNVSSLFRR